MALTSIHDLEDTNTRMPLRLCSIRHTDSPKRNGELSVWRVIVQDITVAAVFSCFTDYLFDVYSFVPDTLKVMSLRIYSCECFHLISLPSSCSAFLRQQSGVNDTLVSAYPKLESSLPKPTSRLTPNEFHFDWTACQIE